MKDGHIPDHVQIATLKQNPGVLLIPLLYRVLQGIDRREVTEPSSDDVPQSYHHVERYDLRVNFRHCVGAVKTQLALDIDVKEQAMVSQGVLDPSRGSKWGARSSYPKG